MSSDEQQHAANKVDVMTWQAKEHPDFDTQLQVHRK